MESGEGIESHANREYYCKLSPEALCVESGEGIESYVEERVERLSVTPQWNPVKELKVIELKSPELKFEYVESGEGIES
mgnify:CR=1 FL=1